MRALVTGGCGFIGSHLVDRLLAAGHTVDVIDDLSSGRVVNLATARRDGSHELRIHQIDVRAPELGELVMRRRPDVVFHLAGPPGGRAADLASVIVGGTANLLEAASAGRGPKIVMAMSADVYGDVPARELPVKDSREFAPRTPRGLAESVTLVYLNAYREQHAGEFCVLVLADVYGPRRLEGVMASFASALAGGEPGVIRGGGNVTRDFVMVDDAVDAFVRASERGSGLIVNVSSGVETSMRSLHDLMASTVGVTLAPTTSGGALDGPARLALDPRRAGIYLGWRPFTSLPDGVGTVMRWWAGRPGAAFG